MKRSKDMNKMLKKGLLLGALTMVAGSALAGDHYLAAKAYTKTMPDGLTVTMWGYVEDTGGACYTASGGAAGRLACVDALPDPAAPGPRLTVGATDANVRIFLTNGLTEPTSVIITGQELPFSSTSPNIAGPVWDDGSHGGRNGNTTKRVRSFVAEADPNGGRRNYVWNNFRGTRLADPGSYIYHSGTMPQQQVYMGLYGAITKDAVDATTTTPAQAYPGVPYENEQVLFYSEIDPELNAAVAAGTLETAIHYHARWFLVNGEPYSTDCADEALANDAASGYPCADMNQTADLAPVAAKTPTLLRFFSAAGETHVPTLQGMHMTIHAEDGNPYTWQTGDTAMGSAAREQYSVMLPPLKTKDAIIEPQVEGRYAIYDGNGYMTNPTDPGNTSVRDPVGGMLRFLSVGPGAANLPPVVGADSATVVAGRTVSIDVLANDSDPEGQGLFIDSVTPGAADCSSGVNCTYMASPTPGSDSFDYTVSDGVNTLVGPATVSVTVVANDPPIAGADSASGDTTAPIIVDVLANDSDPNGDALTVAILTQPSIGTAEVNPDNTITYTSAAAFAGTFDYTITDVDGASATGIVTMSVTDAPGPSAPVASDDAYSLGEAAVLFGNVLDNDTYIAVATTPPVVTLTSVAPVNAVNFVWNGDGTFTYQAVADVTTPITDSFTYNVTDDVGSSADATVTIDVTAVNDVPVANDDTIFLNSMTTTSIAAPGVLANDDDLDGDTLSAINGIVSAGDLTLNSNGSLSYTPQGGAAHIGVGTIATFTYQANDGIADSEAATVTLSRKLSVVQAVCELRNNGNCNWRIEGQKTAGGNVEAWVGGFPGAGVICNNSRRRNGECVRSGNSGPGNWNISFNNSRMPAGPLYLRIRNDADAEILAFPATTQ